MQILVTNDDGIMAPGIQALAQQLTKMGDVVMVAPAEEKSAIGHGITIWDPIRIKKLSFPGVSQSWAVGGTPADCVKLAVQELLCNECSLVISGINRGPNLGTDVLYSGTVSAAIEGAILGIPAIAVSLASYEYEDYNSAAEIALLLAQKLYQNKELLPADTLLNINIPAIPREEIRGLKITRLGIREYDNIFDKRQDPRGNMYYWMAGDVRPHQEIDPHVDIVAVEQNYVSVTPIQFDLTNHRIIKQIKGMGIEKLDITDNR